MDHQILGLCVASTIFGVVALVHLARVITQFEVTIGGYPVPVWLSIVAFVVSGGLCVWLWKLSVRRT